MIYNPLNPVRHIKLLPAISSHVLLFATDEAYSTWMYEGLNFLDDEHVFIVPTRIRTYASPEVYQVDDIRVHPLLGFTYAVRMYPIQQRYFHPNQAETFDYVAWTIQDNHYEEVVVHQVNTI